jgi:hypothetical protein
MKGIFSFSFIVTAFLLLLTALLFGVTVYTFLGEQLQGSHMGATTCQSERRLRYRDILRSVTFVLTFLYKNPSIAIDTSMPRPFRALFTFFHTYKMI